jgi:ParB family chromosome partitioning protein
MNIAHIREVKELPLSSLVIGRNNVRLSDVGKDIDELASSIEKMGLLEPIVVCPAETPGKFEILTGQRRFLAHQKLAKDTILAAIIPERVDETTAKVISLTENLMRRDMNRKDLITICTSLYKQYGTVRDVAEETGLPPHIVSLYVKYDRLKPELKELVDSGEVGMKEALRAQDAASTSGTYIPEIATKLAKELGGMSGAQQERVKKEIKDRGHDSIDDVIEAAKTGDKVVQIIVTIGAKENRLLSSYASDEGTTKDDAARSLIEEGLSLKGYDQGI